MSGRMGKCCICGEEAEGSYEVVVERGWIDDRVKLSETLCEVHALVVAEDIRGTISREKWRILRAKTLRELHEEGRDKVEHEMLGLSPSEKLHGIKIMESPEFTLLSELAKAKKEKAEGKP